jgi:hypothetical protein
MPDERIQHALRWMLAPVFSDPSPPEARVVPLDVGGTLPKDSGWRTFGLFDG